MNRRIAIVQDGLWEEGLSRKTTLELYRKWKTEMGEEDSYDGRSDSVIWFRARTNCLTLGVENRQIGGDTNCFMCGGIRGLETFYTRL